MPVVLASVLLCLNVFAAPSQTAAKPSPRENAETAVVEAIRLLEAKDIKTFLTQFMPPDDMKAQAGTPDAFDAFAQRFETRSDRLLGALKDARTQKPTYDEAKTTATFPLKEPVGSRTTLTLVKIDKYWYISNK
jgi:hypothetical protein